MSVSVSLVAGDVVRVTLTSGVFTVSYDENISPILEKLDTELTAQINAANTTVPPEVPSTVVDAPEVT